MREEATGLRARLLRFCIAICALSMALILLPQNTSQTVGAGQTSDPCLDGYITKPRDRLPERAGLPAARSAAGKARSQLKTLVTKAAKAEYPKLLAEARKARTAAKALEKAIRVADRKASQASAANDAIMGLPREQVEQAVKDRRTLASCQAAVEAGRAVETAAKALGARVSKVKRIAHFAEEKVPAALRKSVARLTTKERTALTASKTVRHEFELIANTAWMPWLVSFPKTTIPIAPG